jgi:hypothetical protein
VSDRRDILSAHQEDPMAFDFAQTYLDEYGSPDERAAQLYERELVRIFETSPEGQEVLAQGFGSGWVGFLVQYGASHVGVTPATMTAEALEDILFEVFPRKVSCDGSAAPGIVAELRAFFRFARREFGFARAAECLALLDDRAEARIKAAFDDSGNWGMAKQMVMAGQQAGFDMTTTEGLNAFMAAYNAGLANKRPIRTMPHVVAGRVPQLASGRDDREARRRKRNQQKAARKRGR